MGRMELEPGPDVAGEDEEPDRELPLRTPPPPKKPLAEFLAEFEQRLADAPDQPATDVHLALEARVEGARRRPGDARATSPPPPDTVAAAPIAPAGAPSDDADEAPTSAAAEDGPTAAVGSEAAPEAGGAPAAQPVEPKRHRGRRHRRRRH